MAYLRVLAIELRTFLFVAVTSEPILLTRQTPINRYHLDI
jgi:hypothetical protein